MEEAPVTAATGALGPVVAKLRALLRRRGDREYRLRCQTRKDVKVIRSKFKSIHSILWVIWERVDLDAEGKELRMEAWRLADDMNDAIDDFILNMKRSKDGRRFIEDKTQPRPFMDLKKRADDVSVQCKNKWKTETSHTTVSSLFSRKKATIDFGGPVNRPRAVDPYVPKDVSELVGVEYPTDKLIEHLVGEEENTPELKMACIVGAAGTGKTTLARLVYEAIKDQFQAWAFVSVASSRNMTEVLTSILQQVGAPSIPVPHAASKPAAIEKHLIDSISNFLKDKRYLIIMDDVWHREEWETINKSLPDNNMGNRIVTTSRFKSTITEMWHDDFDALVYVVQDLRFYDVSAITGEDFDCQHHIMDMCRGTPLAMVCMISALAKERERQQQQGLCMEINDLQDRVEKQVMRNGIHNTPGFEPLVESLELGYNDLPHHMLKTCLLYCSIYPEDHIFRRNHLIRRWIAEGFVCKGEAAEDYFDELVTRGLLEQHGSSFFDYYYEVHPMMRNYLRGKVREDNFITCTSDGVPSSPVSRLCIDWWPSTSSEAVDPLSGIDWQHIRSLVVFKDGKRVPYKHLKHLRVLDVQRLKPLEPHYNSVVLEKQHLKDICGLLRLRHLLLSGGLLEAVDTIEIGPEWEGITEIPTEIARLRYLETFDVRGTGITRLPAEIADLKQLKTLSLSWNQRLAELPREIGKLHQLKTLNVQGTRITELPREIWNLQLLEALYLCLTRIRILPRKVGNLQHLKTLDLRYTDVSKLPREIGGLKNLKNLGVSFLGTLPFEAAQLSNLERLPECMRRAWKNSDLVSSLAGEILSFKETEVFDYGDGRLIVGTKHVHIPQWIKEHFNNIASLDIRTCKLEEQDLKILREMPCLSSLTLRFEAVPRKQIAISSGGFAKLFSLTVDSRVPRIAFQEGAMPMLYSLCFKFQFYGGPPNTDPVGIKHLVRLTIVYFQCCPWYPADSPCISATIDVMRKEAMEHPNEIMLYVPGKDREIFSKNSIITQSSQDRNEARSSSGAQEIEEICEDGSEAFSSSGAQEIEELQA